MASAYTKPSGRNGANTLWQRQDRSLYSRHNALGFSITLRNLLQDSPLASVWLGPWKTEMEILLLLLESNQVGREDNDALAS